MSGTLVYDPDYFQQVIIAYSGFLSLNEYANPSGITLEAFLASSGSQDYSYVSYSPPSGTLVFDTPIDLADEKFLDSFELGTSLDDSVVTTAFGDTLTTSGRLDITPNVVSGLFDNTVYPFTDTTQVSLTIDGQEQLQEYVIPNISGSITVTPDITFGSVDNRDSGVNESESINVFTDLGQGSYQTILLDPIGLSGNILFTSEIDFATSIDVQILVDSGTGIFDVATIQASLLGQDGTVENATSLYEEILEPPIELYFSDVISGVGDINPIQFFPIVQNSSNATLFGDAANQVGFSVFTASVSGVIADVDKIDTILDSYFNVSLRFSNPLNSFAGFLEPQSKLLDSYAFPVSRVENRLGGYARFLKDETIYRKKVWNPSTLPLEGKLLRILFDESGNPLVDIVQQYFVQPLGVTKYKDKFLLTDFPEGAVWEIDPFSGRVRDFLYRVGPPVDITEHEGVLYFTSIVFQGSVFSTNGKFTGVYLQDLGFFPSAIRSYRGRLYVMQPELGRVWDITSPLNVFPVITVPANLAYDLKFLGDKMYILDAVSSEEFLRSIGSVRNSTLYSVDLNTKAVKIEFFGSLQIPGTESSGYSILAFEPVENGFYFSDLGNMRSEIWSPGGVGFYNYDTKTIKKILSAKNVDDFIIDEREIEDFLPAIEDLLIDESLSAEEITQRILAFSTSFNNNIREAKVVLPFKLYNDNGIIHVVDMGIGYSASSEFGGGEDSLGRQNDGSRLGGAGGGIDNKLLGLGSLAGLLGSGGGGGGGITLGGLVNGSFTPESGSINETEEANLDELLAQRYPWLGFENVDVLLDIFTLGLFFEGQDNGFGLGSFSKAKGLGYEGEPQSQSGEDNGGGGGDIEPPAPIKIVDLLIDTTNILYVLEGEEDPDLSGDALPFPAFSFSLIFNGDADPGFGDGSGGLLDLGLPSGFGGLIGEGGGGLNLTRDPGGLIQFNIIRSVTDIIRYISPIVFLSRRKRRRNRPWNFTTSSAIDRSGKGVYMYQVPPFKKAKIRSLKACLFDRTVPIVSSFSLVVVGSDFFAPPPLNATIAEVRELFQDDLRNESPENMRPIINSYPITPGETVILDNLGIIQDLSRVYVVAQEGLWMSFDIVFEEYPDFYSQRIIEFAEQAGIFNSEVLYTLDSNNSYRAV